MRAAIKEAPFSFCFLSDGLLSPIMSKNRYFLELLCVQYLGHGTFHRAAPFILCQLFRFGELSFSSEGSEKKLRGSYGTTCVTYSTATVTFFSGGGENISRQK